MKLRGAFDVGFTDITGSLLISGSETLELIVSGNAMISGSGINNTALGISGSSINAGTLAVAGNIVANEITGSINDTKILFGFVSIDQTSISAAQNISGLTNPVSAGAFYIFDGIILINPSAATATNLTLLWPQGVTSMVGRWQVQTAIIGTGNVGSTYTVNFNNAQSAIGTQMSVVLVPGSTVNSIVPVYVNGTVDTTGATTSLFLGVNAKTSVGLSAIHAIKRGSYLRVFKIR